MSREHTRANASNIVTNSHSLSTHLDIMYTRGHNKQSVSKHEAVQAVRAMSLRHRRRRSCEKNSTSSTVHHIHANCAADCWNPGDAVLMLLPTCESFPYSPNSTAPTSWRQVELHGCAYGTIVVSKIRTTIDPFQRRFKCSLLLVRNTPAWGRCDGIWP